MSFYRVQFAILNDTLEERDAAVNVWHFETNEVGTPANERLDIVNTIVGFYNDIDVYFSSNISGTTRLKIFDLEDAVPRAPVYDSSAALLTPGSTSLPNEVALCMSYRGENVSGVNRRRNRGRVYLGPWATSASADAVGDARPVTALMTAISAAADARLLPVPAPLSLSTITWSVFSRSDALGLAVGVPAPTPEQTYTAAQLVLGFRPVYSAWVDDAFDTQRRRGLRPTTRSTVY